MFSFDARSNSLDTENEEGEYEPLIREQWRLNRLQIVGGLASEFGTDNLARKVTDFRALGAMPFSVIGLHNLFLRQIRDSFSTGAYYPALVGAGALGERILNQLIIALREHYLDHPSTTAEIAVDKSFTNWKKCINALEGWGVVSGELARRYKRLSRLRHRAVHYNTALDQTDARTDALEAIMYLQDIVAELFQPLGGPPRFIAGTSGHTFLSSDAETQPLIRTFFISSSVLVSPRFEMEFDSESPGMLSVRVFDDEKYGDRYPNLSDTEFANHRNDPTRFWPGT